MHELVSVVIPCFDAENWIGDAIRSALHQSWKQIEVIVIDDGSTDKSLQVIQSFGKSIRWESGPNRGGCAARNRGIELARGEYIQFLDADDVLLADCIENKLNVPHDATTLVCCNVKLMDGTECGLLPSFWHLPDYDLETMFRVGTPQTSAPLHRTDILRNLGGFREGLLCAQEYDLHLRLAIERGMIFKSTGHTGVLIRPNSKSVSRSAGLKMPLAIADTLTQSMILLQKRRGATVVVRDACAQHLIRLARILWRQGARAEALQLSKQAATMSRRWNRGVFNGRFSEELAGVLGFRAFESLRDIYYVLLPRPAEESSRAYGLKSVKNASK